MNTNDRHTDGQVPPAVLVNMATKNNTDSKETKDKKEKETIEKKVRKRRSTPWNIGWSAWCKKYFWEGQALSDSQEEALQNLDPGAPWMRKLLIKHRRPLSLLIPAVFFHIYWWAYAIKFSIWGLFPDKFFMSITMIFGSMIAGMTSEGGGAVAFPVMTLAFKIPPSVARDFSLMIQSCGMSAAAFSIFFMRVQLEWHSLILCSIGGVVGVVVGLETVDKVLTPPQKKMGFVSIWFAFAFALFLLNRYHKRTTFAQIPKFKVWKAIVLLISGFIGGMFTSFAGSGLDICSFSVLTLLFRVSEKTATPTSVVLMAGNTLAGFYWRGVMMNDNIETRISPEAWQFLAVCIPIVVIGAPLGSVLGTHFHRQVLASMIYIIDTVALISAFVLVRPTPVLAGISVGIILFGFLFFFLLTFIGHKLLGRIELQYSENYPVLAIENGGNENLGYGYNEDPPKSASGSEEWPGIKLAENHEVYKPERLNSIKL